MWFKMQRVSVDWIGLGQQVVGLGFENWTHRQLWISSDPKLIPEYLAMTA